MGKFVGDNIKLVLRNNLNEIKGNLEYIATNIEQGFNPKEEAKELRDIIKKLETQIGSWLE